MPTTGLPLIYASTHYTVALSALGGVRELGGAKHMLAVEDIPDRWDVPALAGYALDRATAQYHRIEVRPDDGLYSAVLGHLRGRNGHIQC